MTARRVVVVLLGLIGLLLAVSGPGIASECGCTLTGDYRDPASRSIAIESDGTSPGGVYRLTTSLSGGQVTLDVRRVSTNASVFSTTIPAGSAAWGFSPDDHRFVYHHLTGTAPNQIHTIVMRNLETSQQVWTSQVTAGPSRLAFSPNGKYLMHSYTSGASYATINVVNALHQGSGSPVVHHTSFSFQSPPGSPGDSFGTVNWGFSPDANDRTFVYGYVMGQSAVQWNVVNLATRQIVKSETLTSISAFWKFSRCGDVIGLVQQPNQSQVSVRLLKTSNGAALGSQGTYPLASVTLKSTLQSHIANVGGTDHTLALNTADDPCPSAAVLTGVSVSPTSVPGGGGATGTVALSAPAPSGGRVVNLSSSSGAASVPASVTVAAGQTTRTFAVSTSTVSSTTTATLTASSAGVTKTTTLTINAARAVSALSLHPASVNGGDGSTATVTLDGAAPAGGTSVTLSSGNTSVATVPGSVIVAGGQTSRTFQVSTSPVTTSTNVVISAASGGQTRTATLGVSAAPQTSPNAIDQAAGCRTGTLPRNDDGFTDALALPFPVNFFGTTYTHLYVNNNGNVTFNQPLSTFTPFTIDANTPPIIAPFFADVDTRGAASGVVTYGTTTSGGRDAFCVNWVDVGYYNSRTDKLNSFQLVLVDRSEAGTGDFDIVMNYDRILWETGDASGGSNGFGGTSAGAGYSAGTGDSHAFFQFPGSLVNGALLDSNPTTGLTRTSRNSLQLGRHVFEVRNGMAPSGGTISGTVTDSASPPNSLAGAPVQVCPAAGGACLFVTQTGSQGRYTATGLPAGDYLVTASPPAGSSARRSTVGPVSLPEDGALTVDVALTVPTGPPAGTSLTPSSTGGGGVPSVNWNDPLDLETQGCPGGTATYEVVRGGVVIASGTMTEAPAGTYVAQIPPLSPNTGAASIRIMIDCPDGAPDETVEFDIYIDPSGNVRTLAGLPVRDATVTLYRSDSEAGPFEVVPDGSAVMSPDNRRNPDLTDERGHFGWDTIAGFYIVRAEREGCTGPDGAEFVETPALPVPPEVTDLDLRLDCPALDVDLDLDLAPAFATNDAGASHTVTATFTEDGAPVSGALVAFDVVAGPQAGEGGSTTTGADGTAAFTYTGAEAGVDALVATVQHADRTVVSSTVHSEWLGGPADTAPPTCGLSGTFAGPPAGLEVTVQDTDSGLAAIEVTDSENATVTWPSFSEGTTEAVVVRVERIDRSTPPEVELRITDVAGNATVCRPGSALVVVRGIAKPVASVHGGIPSSEDTLTVTNGWPGVQRLDVTVNGHTWKLAGLLEGEERTLDVSSALVPGGVYTVELTAYGRPGSSATVLVWGGG